MISFILCTFNILYIKLHSLISQFSMNYIFSNTKYKDVKTSKQTIIIVLDIQVDFSVVTLVTMLTFSVTVHY